MRCSEIKEHEVVVLKHDIAAHGLLAGDVGTVVGIYPSGGYEVELTAAPGDSVAVVTLAEEDIRPMGPREMLRVRDVTAAPG